MFKADISVEIIKCDDTAIGYCFDCTKSTERLYVLLSLLKENQMNAFSFTDGKESVKVKKGTLLFDIKTQTLFLGDNEIEVLLKLLSDIIQGKAFIGYHYDLECETPNGKVDITFMLKGK